MGLFSKKHSIGKTIARHGGEGHDRCQKTDRAGTGRMRGIRRFALEWG